MAQFNRLRHRKDYPDAHEMVDRIFALSTPSHASPWNAMARVRSSPPVRRNEIVRNTNHHF